MSDANISLKLFSPDSLLTQDFSNGYEAIAERYMAVRSRSGRALVQNWAETLPQGGSIIDIGAGNGQPITSALIEAGLQVSALDASPKMVAAFQAYFPDIRIACEAAEDSSFFNDTYDAALAVGLIFLLSKNKQRHLIQNVANALKEGGKFLFSSPYQICDWEDSLTGEGSRSLGREEYHRILKQSGLSLISESEDEGGTHYFEAEKIRHLMA
ncbi:methyltransferase [Litorimonas cladophorae]|uniref:Methyltransferase n=1 Tax=Litorimonas cladophorae TaxID=1220491 RepID=A0A918KKN1_9PROT|nr:class I SAM-dependent methyltransferase [Litorimonas cladophorae]GGX67396.1 methyltransferase [Litorimonas cladophorae]